MGLRRVCLVLVMSAGVAGWLAAPNAIGQDRGGHDQGQQGRGDQDQDQGRGRGNGQRGGSNSQGDRGYQQHGRGHENGRGHGGRGQGEAMRQQGRAGQQGVGRGRPDYRFRGEDAGRLRGYYRSRLARIDRGRRPHFGQGGYIPGGYRRYLQPVPYGMMGYLPPVPPGYAMGYYDGYVMVYDPRTYLVVSVLNLLQ